MGAALVFLLLIGLKIALLRYAIRRMWFPTVEEREADRARIEAWEQAQREAEAAHRFPAPVTRQLDERIISRPQGIEKPSRRSG